MSLRSQLLYLLTDQPLVASGIADRWYSSLMRRHQIELCSRRRLRLVAFVFVFLSAQSMKSLDPQDSWPLRSLINCRSEASTCLSCGDASPGERFVVLMRWPFPVRLVSGCPQGLVLLLTKRHAVVCLEIWVVLAGIVMIAEEGSPAVAGRVPWFAVATLGPRVGGSGRRDRGCSPRGQCPNVAPLAMNRAPISLASQTFSCNLATRTPN